MIKNLEQNLKEEVRQSYFGMLKHGNTEKLKAKIATYAIPKIKALE